MAGCRCSVFGVYALESSRIEHVIILLRALVPIKGFCTIVLHCNDKLPIIL